MRRDAVQATVRRLGQDDADAILDLSVECDLAELGEVDVDRDDVQRNALSPHSRCFGADAPDGRLAGFGWVGLSPGRIATEAEVRLRPGADPALADRLVALVRAEAAEIDPGRPLHVHTSATDGVVRPLLESSGATPARFFWRMVIDFTDETPGQPVPNPDVVIRNVDGGEDDLRRVFHVIDTAFLDHFGVEGGRSYDEFARRNIDGRDNDYGLWWLAFVGGAPAAALMGNANEGFGAIGTLGTLREFRGRGLGRVLLRTAFAEMHARGCRRVGLGVDAASPTGAVGLYESVGMRQQHEWVVYDLPLVR